VRCSTHSLSLAGDRGDTLITPLTKVAAVAVAVAAVAAAAVAVVVAAVIDVVPRDCGGTTSSDHINDYRIDDCDGIEDDALFN
jgi:hypothetical protein